MNLLEEVGKAMAEVIKWPGMAYSELCDLVGISEWEAFFIAIGIIGAIIGGRFIYKRFWR